MTKDPIPIPIGKKSREILSLILVPLYNFFGTVRYTVLFRSLGVVNTVLMYLHNIHDSTHQLKVQ